MEDQKIKKIHFIGIGGIGVSALARYFLARGDEVSGSDAAESEILEDLRRIGVKISTPKLPHPNPLLEKERGQETDLVIYSAAVKEDDPELVEARRLGIKAQKYAEALGEITKEKFTIAISGTHGKSTTTAMVGLILEKAGLDPTVIVGTKMREWGNSNFRAGQSPSAKLGINDYLVIEADEYDRSFLNYWPKMIILTNIEEDHLDTYPGGLPDILETFRRYISRLPEDGTLIVNEEDENIMELVQSSKLKVKSYSSKLKVKNLNLKVSGKHNFSNAMAAMTAARALGVEDKISIEALNDFSGTWRRMEYKGEVNGAKIFDDYGHHPTEIKATLEGARELLGKNPPQPPFLKGGEKLWCVFQPHQYHRTYDLFDKFVGAFGSADKLILLPIYSVAGREDEEIKKKVSSELLTKSLIASSESPDGKEIIYLENFDKTAEYLKKNLAPGDLCLIMGAGDIYKLTSKLFK